MNVNWNFYKQEDDNINDDEKEFIERIKRHLEKNEINNENTKEENNLEKILTLSKIRENILSWYPFKENAKILEIGANLGEITGLLCENASKVVAIENSKMKIEFMAKRYADKENLDIIAGYIENIKLDEKFDYITLIGTLERRDVDYKQIITIAKELLNDGGKVLLAFDNKLGIKYFSKTDKTGICVTNPVDKKFINIEKLYNYLHEIGLNNIKTYYPMPDYKLTNVIFTDLRPLSKNDLSRNVVYNSEDTINFYDENTVYRELLDLPENVVKNFMNSYFLEIAYNEQFEKDAENEKVKLISFSNMRKPKYRIKTIVKENFVYKYPANDESQNHIEETKKNIDIIKNAGLKTLDSYNENEIISEFCKEKTLDEVIMEFAKQNEKEKAIDLMKRFKDEIKYKLKPGSIENNVFDKYKIKYDKEEILSMYFVEDGLWDLIFQNCFYVNGEFFFYDQEWCEKNLPVEYIMYRAIKYFVRLKKYISDEEMYSILEIDKSKIKLFDELDDKIQEEIRNPAMWQLNTQGENAIELKRKVLTLKHEINLLNIEKAENEQKLTQVEQIDIQKDQEIANLKNQLNLVYNSTSWKLTKPFRKLRGEKKTGKN